MFREQIVLDIKNNQYDPEYEKQLIGELYSANLNLIHIIAKEQCLTSEDYYDYMQLGYDALLDTIKVYNPASSFSFLSYFRRIFKHKIYLFNLEFRYPMRIKSPQLLNGVDFHIKSYGVNPETECSIEDAYHYTAVDSVCYDIESRMMQSTILSILKYELSATQFSVLYKIFWCNETKSEIACALGLTYSQVRCCYVSALRKLRRNTEMQHIAKDMYGINIS